MSEILIMFEVIFHLLALSVELHLYGANVISCPCQCLIIMQVVSKLNFVGNYREVKISLQIAYPILANRPPTIRL